MNIFSRVRNMRRNITWQEAAKTLPLDRPLTPEERNVAEHLLRYAGVPGAEAFIPQLAHVRVTGQCSCGCPTIDFQVPPNLRVPDPRVERMIADAGGRVDGKLVGAMIFQDDGLLSCMEVYRIEDPSDDAFGLPPVETIERLVWDKPSQPPQ